MKFQYLQVLAAIAALPAVFAAPPGIIRWQTIGSPSGCSGNGPTYLNTIGFINQPGIGCTSLNDTDPTLYFVNFLLESPCSINFYTEEACPSGSLELIWSRPTNGTNECLMVPGGFRALSVTC